jgi:hypothetical protein
MVSRHILPMSPAHRADQAICSFCFLNRFAIAITLALNASFDSSGSCRSCGPPTTFAMRGKLPSRLVTGSIKIWKIATTRSGCTSRSRRSRIRSVRLVISSTLRRSLVQIFAVAAQHSPAASQIQPARPPTTRSASGWRNDHRPGTPEQVVPNPD